jgi:hypothetical protein
MNIEDKRAASKALKPYRDRAKDKISSFFYKTIAIGFVILVLILISINNEAP